jgi:hypothetical protein
MWKHSIARNWGQNLQAGGNTVDKRAPPLAFRDAGRAVENEKAAGFSDEVSGLG